MVMWVLYSCISILYVSLCRSWSKRKTTLFRVRQMVFTIIPQPRKPNIWSWKIWLGRADCSYHWRCVTIIFYVNNLIIIAGASGIGELLANTLAVRNVNVVVLDVNPIVTENCTWGCGNSGHGKLTIGRRQYHIFQMWCLQVWGGRGRVEENRWRGVHIAGVVSQKLQQI